MGLRVENLSLQRGMRLLQAQLNLELKAGECLWIKGPNGVGKSTLLETLCGFRPNIDGRLFWNDEFISSKLDEYHQSISYLGHKNGNNPNMSVESALRFYGDLYASNQMDDVFKIIGLEERRDIFVKELSAGQQKRLAIGRMLLRDTPLWVLDEPSVSLDQDGVDFLIGEIRKKQKAGGMVIYTSHVELGLKSKTLNLKPMEKKQRNHADAFLGADWEGVS